MIEVVDREENIARVLPALDEMVADGLVTLERVEVIVYRGGREPDSNTRHPKREPPRRE